MSPGIYDDIPNADYHAETAWLSASQLKRHLPEWYTAPTGRDALDFGSAFHAMTLGTNETIASHNFASWRSKAAEDARAEADAAGHIPVLTDDLTHLNEMVAAIKRHPIASRMLYDLPGRNEVSVFAENHTPGGELDYRAKCRPDRLLDGLIVDLKSTPEKPGADNLTKTILRFGYDLQAAHYLEVAHLAGLDVDGFAFVFVGKRPPYYVTVTTIEGDLLARGDALRRLALDRATHATDAYAGASDFLTLDDCPPWAWKGIPA